jgi:divalent metal cation (Fe/Co/Zn/Cd) transporter
MRPTSLSVLVVAGLAAAAVGWLLLSAFYTQMPRLPWLPIIVLGALAVVEAILAQNTAARIQHKPGSPRVDPLAVARFAVLAKASSLAGALFAGFSAGLLAWLALEPTKAARDDVPAAIAGVVAALALVVAALWLERSCRVPEQPDQKDGGKPGRQGGRS